MKNVNQEGLNELSQNELTQIEGGSGMFNRIKKWWEDFVESFDL